MSADKEFQMTEWPSSSGETELRQGVLVIALSLGLPGSGVVYLWAVQ